MWSMQQQETSSMGHAILEAGMPPFLNWGKNLKYGESPPMEQSQEASRLGQKPEIWGIPPNGAVTGSKQIGAKT